MSTLLDTTTSQVDVLAFRGDAVTSNNIGALEGENGPIPLEQVLTMLLGDGKNTKNSVARKSGLSLKTIYNFLDSLRDDKPESRSIGTGAKLALFMMDEYGEQSALEFLRSLRRPVTATA